MPQRLNRPKRSAVFIDLGLLEYKRALDLQIQTLQSKIDQTILEDRILFVEHPSVFTLGKRGGEENLGVSKKFLSLKKIDLVQTNRGGDITYHCPGQAVMYPIVDLAKNKIGVKDFVNGLEEIMKRTAMDFKIDADRNPKNHGIWVGNSKIGSVGISIKRGISFHGLAMNIHPDLEPFSWINPCGLTDISITSVENELKKSNINNYDQSDNDLPDYDLAMDRIKDAFINHFSSVFNYSIKN
ncbi:MAG: lipoyl(octanoyl) transferase LipB [Desulfobacula sp.]|uniref:lipoyl(octanoyl) transferase LipB n=1 Tax=Desulfobacula sp. TaxID=2593537 RepID=UPI0025C5707D|nr:lipoyl(octanoyl) transferase LipB [Desulfobacula sp.]MCD4719431.1 lipoyl(octanoyl) transferase LipB [Desulfobacula sp.]